MAVRWKGEVDYLGPCDRQADADCDHWFTAHDNCVSTFNPDQSDHDDDGIGDACQDGCPCDPDNDIDHDGWCGVTCPSLVPTAADNCPMDFNPGQENCNFISEQVQSLATLGDICDPVPCPASTAEMVTGTQTVCGPQQGVTVCTRTDVRSQTSTIALGAHPVTSVTHDSTSPALGSFAPVRNVPTESRFCNNVFSGSHPTRCLAPENISDGLLRLPDDSAGAWHRVTYGLRPFLPVGYLPRGATQPVNYDGSTRITPWNYLADSQFWLTDPQNPRIPTSSLCPTCLDGSFWRHGDTSVGDGAEGDDSVLVQVNPLTLRRVFVGSHGMQLANNYFPISPSKTVAYCPTRGPFFTASGILPGGMMGVRNVAPTMSAGITSQSILWQATGPQLPFDAHVTPATMVIAIAGADQTSVGGLAALQDDGSGISLNTGTRADCGSSLGSRAAEEMLASGSAVWASAVEPSATIAPLPSAFVALALSQDGTAVLDAAIVAESRLFLHSELALPCGGDSPCPPVLHLPSLAPQTNVAPPARANFISAFSRSARGVFVLGGTTRDGSTPLHDAWFFRVGGGWVDVSPENTALGNVLAATYSFADQRLYILDGIGAPGQDSVRILRIDPATRAAAVLLVARRFHPDGILGLTVDRDGTLLISSAGKNVSRTAQVVVDRDGDRAHVTIVHVERGALLRPPIVDPNGYSFVVRDRNGAVKVRRHESLGGHEPGEDCDAEDAEECDGMDGGRAIF
jgi:hypothetical protein